MLTGSYGIPVDFLLGGTKILNRSEAKGFVLTREFQCDVTT